MRERVNRRLGGVLALAIAVVALHAERAMADPIGFSGFLEGQPRFAQIEQELTLSFPDFTVMLSAMPHLISGFCFVWGTGTAEAFPQSKGNFSGPSAYH